MDIVIPSIFDRDNILQLLENLDAARDLDNVTVDFSRLRFSKPTGMLVAGSKLRNWREYRRLCGYQSWHRGINESIMAHSYLMHLGFLILFTLSRENRSGKRRGLLATYR